MFCRNCGNKLDEDAVFCTNCGKKVAEEVSKEEIKFCMNCGSKLDEDSSFCSNCGKKIEFNEDDSVNTTTESSKTEVAKEIPEDFYSTAENPSKISTEELPIVQTPSNESTQRVPVIETEKKEIPSELIFEGTSSKTEVSDPKDLSNDKELKSEIIENTSAEDADTKNNLETSILTHSGVTLLSVKEFNCLSNVEKESYKLKLDTLLGDEQTDEEFKKKICKTLIQYGYMYYCHPKSTVYVEKESLYEETKMISNETKNQEINVSDTINDSKNATIQNASTEKRGISPLTIILIIVLMLSSLALIILVNVSNDNAKNNSVSKHNTEFKIGDIIQENGTPIAVIFKEASGGQPALGVALKQGVSLQWASCHYEPDYNISQGYEKNIRGLQNLTDGHDSYQILCLSVKDWQKKGNYPAFEYAENYSAGSFTDWYLPTAKELYFLYINLEKVNQSLMQCGGKKIKIAPGEIFYWTCNQVENTSWAAVCTDFYYGIDSKRKNVGEGNQKGGGFKVLPICRVYIKEN